MAKLGKKLTKFEFYCLKCHKRCTSNKDDLKLKNVRNYKVGTVKMMKGHCKKCDCKVNKFVKKSMKL